jgi:hypothetical protein
MIDLNQEELKILNNIILQVSFPLGDAKVVIPILEKIQAHITDPDKKLTKVEPIKN